LLKGGVGGASTGGAMAACTGGTVGACTKGAGGEGDGDACTAGADEGGAVGAGTGDVMGAVKPSGGDLDTGVSSLDTDREGARSDACAGMAPVAPGRPASGIGTDGKSSSVRKSSS